VPFSPGREKRRKGTAIANQVIEYLIVLAFVVEYLPKDDNAWLVADILDLLGVLGDILGFVKFQTAQSHVDPTNAIGEVIGFSSSGPVKGKRRTSQGAVPASPKICVALFCIGQCAKSHAPLRVYFPFRQSCVGFTPTHLGLPITFQNPKDSFAVLWI
jgi:hypothetical protein